MPQTDRLRGLVDAGIALSSELSLDDLLQKLAETAAGLTGARYAALGVIDETGTGLERFLHTGLDAETVAAIGHLPRGRGILGALITDARSLRLESIADDPRSVGFPSHHPPMRGFLGVPILLRGRAFGNLYLTEKASGSFTAEDQELVETLASQAAVAIENARLYEDATSWSAQLEALNEVGTALASEIELAPLLELIARRLRGLIDARLVTIALPAADGTLRIEAADGERAEEIVGMQLERTGSKSGRVLERRRAERVDALAADPEVDQDTIGRLGAGPGSSSRSRSGAGRSASSSPTTSTATIRGSRTRTCAWPRPSPRAPRSPSTCPSAWRATRSAGLCRRRSWSGAGSRASCTTRRARS